MRSRSGWQKDVAPPHEEDRPAGLPRVPRGERRACVADLERLAQVIVDLDTRRRAAERVADRMVLRASMLHGPEAEDLMRDLRQMRDELTS